MKFQNKGAVPVQIAPLLISQFHDQNQSIGALAVWRQNTNKKKST